MDQMRNEVMGLQHKIKDFLDQPGHASATLLKNEVQGLEDDLQVKKNKYTIEDRIKRVLGALGNVQASGAMSPEHVQQLAGAFESLRMRARNL